MLRKLTFLAVSAVIAFGTLSFDLQQEIRESWRQARRYLGAIERPLTH